MKNVLFLLLFGLMGVFALQASPPDPEPIKDKLGYHLDHSGNSVSITVCAPEYFATLDVGEAGTISGYSETTLLASFHPIPAFEVTDPVPVRWCTGVSYISAYTALKPQKLTGIQGLKLKIRPKNILHTDC